MPRLSIDLHLHSIHSDGKLSVKELVKKLKKHKVRMASLTDHDCIDGSKEFAEEARRASLTAIPGVEISASERNIGLHILGYGIDLKDHALQNLFQEQIRQRRKKFLAAVSKFRKAGFFIDPKHLQKILARKTIAKPHIFSLICSNRLNQKRFRQMGFKNGQPAQGEFIETFLSLPGQLGYAGKNRVTCREAIKLIRRAGGIAVWAHSAVEKEIKSPKQFLAILKSLVSYGLSGLEVYSSAHNPNQIKRLAKLAKKHRLLATVGTDNHDGSHFGKLKVPEEVQKEISNFLR